MCCWNTEDEDEDVDHDGHGQEKCNEEDADDSTANAPIRSWKRV